MKGLLLLVLLVGCATYAPFREPSAIPYNTWREYIQREKIATEGLASLFTDPKYLKLPWKTDENVVMDQKPLVPHQIQNVPLNCKDKTLYPTHPQQDTKAYLYADFASYDYTKLPALSSACRIPNPTKKYCLRATSAHIAVPSDLFEDKCGNIYRGYWFVSFLKSDESMGTLLSKGRTVYERPNSEFANDFMNGDTYSVSEENFLFLSKPWPKDLKEIQVSRSRALKKEYVRDGKLFKLKPSK